MSASYYHRLDDFYHQEPSTDPLIDSISRPTFETLHLTRSFSQTHATDPSNPRTKWSKPRQVAALWSLGVFAIALLNAVLLGWALRAFGTTNLIVKLQVGSCSRVNKINSWVHLVINLLSTAILSGSNYCMQYLSAPTRSQINRAHARREWLDIGIPSWHNLKFMNMRRRVAWWALGLSSIPIHLLNLVHSLNSAFFVSLSTNGYNVLVTTEAFLQNGTFDDMFLPVNNTSWDGWIPNSRLWYSDRVPWQQYVGRLRYDGKSDPLYSDSMKPFDPRNLQTALTLGTTFEELDKKSCIKAYSVDLLTNRRNLVLVSTNSSLSNSSILYGGSSQYLSQADPEPETGIDYNPYAWSVKSSFSSVVISNRLTQRICSDPRILMHTGTTVRADQSCFSYVQEVTASSSTWSPWMYDVERCLSERTPESCSFSLNLVILIVVLLCNLTKLFCMLSFTLIDFGNPVLALGDGIRSFLEEPDTAWECLRVAYGPDSTTQTGWTTNVDGSEVNYVASQRILRRSLASKQQWKTLCVLSSLAVISVGGFLGLAISVKPPQVSLWSLGFGKVHVQSLIHGWLMDKFNGTAHPTIAILASVIVANLPQTILSAIYLSLNSVCTSIACGREWNRLSTYAKGLRITSTPRGEQRSDYFLSLPYAISLPMILSMALLHWLISQSIFLAVIAVYDPNGTLKNPIAVATCGFSPIAMICVLTIGCCGFGTIVLYGSLKIQYSMPLVQNKSSDIAAACRVPSGQRLVDPTKLLVWGIYGRSFFGPKNLKRY